MKVASDLPRHNIPQLGTSRSWKTGSSDIRSDAATIRSTFFKSAPATYFSPQRTCTCARQAFFVFLSSPRHFSAVSHWKQVIYGWRLHHLPKTTYLSRVQNNLGVKAAAFTSTSPMGRRRHDKNGDAKHTIPRRHGGWRLHAEKHASYLHPQYTVNQLITKKFNIQLRTKHFTHNLLKINWLQTKNTRGEGRKVKTHCVRVTRARWRDWTVATARTTADRKRTPIHRKRATLARKQSVFFSPSFFQNLADSNNFT